MPIGLCDRLDVIDAEGSIAYFAADPQIRQEMVKSRLGGSYVIVEGGFYEPLEGMNAGAVYLPTSRQRR